MVLALAPVLMFLLVGNISFLSAMGMKKVEKGYLGVNIESLKNAEKEDVKFGVRIAGVLKGEAGDKAGMEKNDIIQFFNGEKIRRPSSLIEAVRDCKPGEKVEAKILRDGKPKVLSVVLGKVEEKVFSYHMGKDGKHLHGKFYGEPHKKHFTIKKDGDYIFMGTRGGYLGVYLQELNDELADYFGVKDNEGVLVLKVAKESPAKKAGLKGGDVIVKLEDKKTSRKEDITDFLAEKKKGDKVKITIMRHKKEKSVTVELGERKGLGDLKIIQEKLDDKTGHFFMSKPHIYCTTDKDGNHCTTKIIIKEGHGKKIEKKPEHVESRTRTIEKKLKKIKEKHKTI